MQLAIVLNSGNIQPAELTFNSAKFFDIEYQAYGDVPSELEERQSQFYWQHPVAERAIRIVYNTSSGTFVGLNTFGIRVRHHVIDGWLNEKKDIQYVITHLPDANFDPEFFRRDEPAIVEAFNMHAGTNLKPAPKQWKRILKWMGV